MRNIILKEGVCPVGVHPVLWRGIEKVRDAWTEAGAQLRITSLCDGAHGTHSWHYKGCAADLGTKEHEDAFALAQITRDVLPHGLFDVVFEDEGGPNEHIHVEYDPF